MDNYIIQAETNNLKRAKDNYSELLHKKKEIEKEMLEARIYQLEKHVELLQAKLDFEYVKKEELTKNF